MVQYSVQLLGHFRMQFKSVSEKEIELEANTRLQSRRCRQETGAPCPGYPICESFMMVFIPHHEQKSN
jgi:hypothetical protein